MKYIVLAVAVLASVCLGALADRRMAPSDVPAAVGASNTTYMTPSGGDDTNAWNAACNAIPLGGSGEIRFNAGVFSAQQPWVCNGRSMRISGRGESVTTINVKHSGTAMTLAPSTPFQQLVVRDMTFQAAAPCATARGLAIAFPFTAGHSNITLRMSDVNFLSNLDGPSGCNPGIFMVSLQLTGVRNGTVARVQTNGPGIVPAVSGTVGIEIADSFSLHLDDIQAVLVDRGVLVSDYSEGIYLTKPTFSAANIGFQNVVTSTFTNGFSGLSFTMSGAECDVVFRCIDWHNVSRGYAYDNRMANRLDTAGGTLVALIDTVGVLIHDNSFDGVENSVLTGVIVSQGPNLKGTLNQITNNTCTNMGSCVVFAANTSTNVAQGNAQPQDFPGGAFADKGTNNYMSWISGPASISTVNGMVVLGGNNQQLLIVGGAPSATLPVLLEAGSLGPSPSSATISALGGTNGRTVLSVGGGGGGQLDIRNLVPCAVAGPAAVCSNGSGSPAQVK